jgi:hypothetical protein
MKTDFIAKFQNNNRLICNIINNFTILVKSLYKHQKILYLNFYLSKKFLLMKFQNFHLILYQLLYLKNILYINYFLILNKDNLIIEDFVLLKNNNFLLHFQIHSHFFQVYFKVFYFHFIIINLTS